MLKVKIYDRFLDLSKTSVSFELLNPIFNDIGSFSYPFTFPANAHNRSILGFPDRVHNYQPTNKSHECEIYIAGMIWKRGRLIIREANDREIKANFAVGEGYFYNVIKDLKLNEVDLGGERRFSDYSSGTSAFFQIHNKSYPETDFTLFPVQWPNFFEGNPEHERFSTLPNVGFINQWSPSGFGYNHYNLNTSFTIVFPFLNYLIDKLTERTGSTLNNSIFQTDEALKQLVIFRNAIDRRFIPSLEIFWDPITFNLAHSLPEVTFLELFKHLENLFKCFLFHNDINNSIDFILFKDIIKSASIDFCKTFKVNNISKNFNDGFQTSFSQIENDVFIKDISLLNFKGSVDVVADLPSSGNSIYDCYYVEGVFIYYYWDQVIGTPQYDWFKFSTDVPSYFDGEKSVKVEIPNLFSRDFFGRFNVQQKGQWISRDAEIKRPSATNLQLMFWHGILPSGAPSGGPFNTRYNFPKYDVIAPYSLEWPGEYGLKEQFYKEWIQFKQNSVEAEYSMPLTPAQLKQIDFSRKYRFAQANWLFDKIRFTVTNRRISPATVTAWKV